MHTAFLLSERERFLHFVQRRIASREQAEDILQSAYMRALEHEAEPADGEQATQWFFRVLRNAIIDQYRRNASEQKALAAWMQYAATLPAPPEEPGRSCACLPHILDTLRPRYAELLRTVELGEQPLQQFAREHDLSPAAAGVLAHRARAALQKQVRHVCGSCAEDACLDCHCAPRG